MTSQISRVFYYFLFSVASVLHVANPVPYDNSGYDHFVEQLREMNAEKSSEETEKKVSWFSKLIGFFDR